MTRRVGPSEQGRLQGSNQSLQGITSILGPLLLLARFLRSWAIRTDPIFHMPGLPVLIAAALVGLAMIFGLRVRPPRADHGCPHARGVAG